MLNCEEVTPDIEAYALGALPDEEMDAIKEHLAACPACRNLLESYNLTIESLALEAGRLDDAFEPPAGHTARFRARLEQRPQLRLNSSTAEELAEKSLKSRRQEVRSPRRMQPWWKRAAWGGLTLTAALVVGLGLWVSNLQSQLDRQNSQVQAINSQISAVAQERDSLKGQVGGLQQERDGLKGQVGTLADERDGLKGQVGQLLARYKDAQQSQYVSLLLTKPGATTRSAGNPQLGLTVLMAPAEKDVALVTYSWPSLQEGQEYHLWLYHTSGQVVSGGVVKLRPLPEGNLAEALLTVPDSMANYTTLFITVEKPGVQSPTGPELIRDKLA